MQLKNLVTCFMLLTICATPAVCVETIRVRTTEGVPRLVVDGRPVRARVFFGIPGTRPKSVGAGSHLVAFEFQPLEDEPTQATMHLRFGETPGRIDVDDIRVQDMTDGGRTVTACDFEDGTEGFNRLWLSWPRGGANTVGNLQVVDGQGRDGSRALRITLRKPEQGDWPDFHLYHRPNLSLKRDHRYRVSLWIRTEQKRQLAIAFYRPGEQFTYLGGPPGSFASQIKLAADVGVDMVSFPLRMPWPRPGEVPDWSSVERQCQAVVDANPRALLLPRIWMGPPRWWYDKHPEDRMVWDRQPVERPDVVVASPAWREAAAARLAAMIEHLEAEFGQHMAGYHPTGQNTGEWFYQNTWGPALNGYSESSQRAWRRWLRSRYENDQQLKSAWQLADATLQAALVPAAELRRGAPFGLLRDPVRERALIDFAEFQQEMMAECVCHFARVARRATQGRKLVVFFYGYTFEFAAIGDGAAISGHYGLRRVLESPDIDVLCSPISYYDRALGGSGPAMTAAESVTLAGKMWLVEDDTRTYLGTGSFPGWRDGVDNIQDTNELLLRNTGQCAIRNFATWWMDLGGTGWFDDPRMWVKMKQLGPLDRALLEQPRPYRPDVAVVVDEKSMMCLAGDAYQLTRPLVYESRRPLGRMGTAYGQYLLDDVLDGKVDARLLVFLAAWAMSGEQCEQLAEVTRGRVAMWCYAPGYYADRTASLAAMQQLTGFKLEPLSVPKAWAKPTARGRALGLTEGFGTEAEIKPLFAVTDAKSDEILATYSDGSVAVAMRSSKQGTSLFSGVPGLSSELLRLAARQASVHLFTETDCNVYHNGPHLVLHASQDGPINLHTGASKPVIDLLTGRQIGQGPRVRLPLRSGETRVLKIQ